MKIIKFFIVFAFVGIILFSCNQETNNISSDKASLEITLTDNPACYEAVLIDVQDVYINYAGDDTGWVHLEYVEKGIYNLLDFTAGNDTLIAKSEVDTGIIANVRLILGDNNSLVMEGDTIPLSTPSAQQSGLKIKINKKLIGGVSYKIMLDFDAAKSVVKAGNSDKYNLKPVIRAILEAQDGAISGSISDTIQAVVYALNDIDSVGTYPDDAGEFLLQGLEAGGWDVVIDAADSNYADTVINNVVVENGNVTALGYITLHEE